MAVYFLQSPVNHQRLLVDFGRLEGLGCMCLFLQIEWPFKGETQGSFKGDTEKLV